MGVEADIRSTSIRWTCPKRITILAPATGKMIRFSLDVLHRRYSPLLIGSFFKSCSTELINAEKASPARLPPILVYGRKLGVRHESITRVID